MEPESKYFSDRHQWRAWLQSHFGTATEIWLEYPKKATGKERISYNDAVEEALCVGWIDSKVKSLNEKTTIQRFCPRRKNSTYSQANKERLIWLLEHDQIHPTLIEDVRKVVADQFEFPEDILTELKKDKSTWENYQKLSAPYTRIRVAYIESARNRPAEFRKRLDHFIAKTRENKLIKGFGGIDEYSLDI